MICFEAYIDDIAVSFLSKNKKLLGSFQGINSVLKKKCGIIDFFNNQNESDELKNKIEEQYSKVEEPNRREYGDFQTNDILANQIVKYIAKKGLSPEFVLEPTCGKGSFIVASLKNFKSIKKLVGVEIYQPYVWESKYRILSYYIQNPTTIKPEIEILHANAFEFSYADLSKQTKQLKTLVIGNPPWVTNSELGSIESKNLPQKSNFKKHSGFDAITGKGNFDIGEYISLLMLNSFDKHNGIFAFLIKNSVIKNIINDQRRNVYSFGETEKLNIDSKKEFNVSVEASLFLTELNKEPDFICQELDFYSLKKRTAFGWHNNKFVYSVSDYNAVNNIDGKSQFVWRQGIKHDCSKIMEIETFNGHYSNGLKQEVNIEKDLLFGLLKSSDLKKEVTNKYRKLTIVTQQKIGQDTKYIERDYPLTFEYLNRNKDFFDKRKSSIYKGKPSFSIFGVGDYSFAPYKIAISGMYKTTHFTLVLPENEKPIMLDDTCYFIGFDNIEYARIAHFLLNTKNTQKFLKSIIFLDSKRPITKEILMRIDFKKVFDLVDFNLLKDSLKEVSIEKLNTFKGLINRNTTYKQARLF
jgi:hypothetical protein